MSVGDVSMTEKRSEEKEKLVPLGFLQDASKHWKRRKEVEWEGQRHKTKKN